ncbi:MAG: DUF1735 domain-containing protein [Prevotella sp.]|jgi:hypothetical protein
MNIKIQYLLVFVLFVTLVSCNDDDIFEQEMYKNRVALISSDYYNSYKEVVHLTGEEVVGYIAASVGGTHAPTQDMDITLKEDPTQLAFYNYSIYDADESLYAKALAPSKYEIADYTIHIKAGERTGRTMIKLRPEGLSPDSVYFISLKADETPGVEINPKKNTILYQVLLENDYASQATNSLYTMTGTANGMATAANKILFPLTRNRVRMIAGNENFISKVPEIKKTSLISLNSQLNYLL